MKILQVVPVFSDQFGGTTTVVRSISKELAKRHEVVVYTTNALDPKHDFEPKTEDIDGYRVCYFKRILLPSFCFGIFGQLNLSLDMINAAKKDLDNFDVVHVHSWQQCPELIIHHYAKKFSVPYVLQVHGSLHKFMIKEKLKVIYNVFFGNRILRDASRVVALSQMEAQEYQGMGESDKKIVIIPNGIDLSKYCILPAKGLFKKRFHIQEETKIILYLGRVNRTKGIDFLVKAYAQLTKTTKYSDTLLVIVGPDDGYSAEVNSLVKSLGISNLVLFTGLLSEQDKISAYVDSAICAYLSPLEPFGLVTLEAAVCGTPVIVSKGTPLSEVVEKNKFGFSVRYG